MRRRGRPGLLGVAARTAVVAGTATAVSGSMRNKQEQKAEAAQTEQQQEQAEQQQIADQQQQINELQAAQQPAAPTGETDIVSELEKLAQLKDSGVLSEAEFDAAKAKLLAS